MRKILPLIIVGILVLSGLGAVAILNEEYKYKALTVNFSEPIIKTENQFATINFDEANTFLRKQGKPVLPSYIHTFSFPFGTKIRKVTCELNNYQEKTLSNIIMPSPIYAANSRTIVKNELESINYGSDPYPDKWFDYDIGCGLNGRDLNIFVKTEVFPVKYYPNENRIKWANDAEIIVEYELPIEPIIFDDEYNFIVIGPAEFSDELAPFVDHKINRGISTIFVSLDDIYTGVHFPADGRDDAEKIKYFIKNAMENWGTSYVLLVGSWDETNHNYQLVPVRETHVYINHPTDPDAEIFISDLYYADIYDGDMEFCSWDSNNNDVFGEFNWSVYNYYDEVDLYPDIFFGRLACTNSDEVITCVNKIIKYENDAAYSQEWFKDMVVIGGDTWVPPGDYSGIPEGEYIIEHVIDVMYGFDFNEIYATNGRLGTWVPPYGCGDITSSINKGCGFLEWSGHGNLNVWATHRYEGSEHNWIPTLPGHYTNGDVKNLNNGDELPIVVVGGCSCGKFNRDRDCFAWSFLLNPDGGGIAVMAASGLLYSDNGTNTTKVVAGLIEINSFKSYKELHALTFGEMWAWAIKKYIDMCNLELEDEFCYDYKTMEQWQAFGDPTLAIGPESQPPLKPNRPTGPTEGNPDNEYTFYALTSDPDGDDISYIFDWGDGSFSDWIGPVESGTPISENHTWTVEDKFDIRVRAQDTHGDISEWSDPLTINIPRTKVANHNIFLTLFDRFVDLFPVIKIALQFLV